MTKINNLARYAFTYAYTVARIYEGEWWFWGSYSNLRDAVIAAKDIDGMVFPLGEFEAGDN